jgi:histidinol dehydrogenase
MSARSPIPSSWARVRFAAIGRLAALTDAETTRIIDRSSNGDAQVALDVTAILGRVRAEGDQALFEFAQVYDRVSLPALEVPRREFASALRSIPDGVVQALRASASAIEAFHRALVPRPIHVETWPGVRLTRIAEPLRRVGVYAPGGTATYPSSVLMGVIPARVAGVEEIVVCSPPSIDGRPAAAVLAAAAIAGADRVFAVGGAGAIGAMAFGTATVPRVDRIVGPGNAWVAEAKRQVMGTVGIDCPAGPSELLVLADDSATPARVAAELIAQAEHDPAAAVVLVSTSEPLIAEVAEAIAGMMHDQPRRSIIADAFAARGALLVAGSLDEALDFASRWAPEHLLLAVRDPRSAAGRVRNAGTIFLGETSSVTFGDYVTGANHVLPTAGAARSWSGLDTMDFVRRVTLQEVSPQAVRTLAAPATVLAEMEGLQGHADAARLSGEGSAGTATLTTILPEPPLRTDYAGIVLYDPSRAPRAIDLSDNTNLFGMDPVVGAALEHATPELLSRYPSVYADSLRRAWSDCYDLPVESITTGAGSDDVIDSAIRAFCEPGDTLAFPWPTFGVVQSFSRMNGIRPVRVAATNGNDIDVDSLLAGGTRMIYLCRPNNPTGTRCDRSHVTRLIDEFRGVILIDEAYADFAGESLASDAIRSRNAIVLRTLSKAWGLAGLRLGIAVGPPRLIREVEKSRGPYKVGALAEHVGVTALSEGRAHVRERVRLTIENRDRLTRGMRGIGLRVIPSVTNFVLVVLGARGEAARVKTSLGRIGIGVRAFEDLPGLGDCIRVTVGPWPMMQAILDALVELGPAGGTYA